MGSFKPTALLILLFSLFTHLRAQELYSTREGYISFLSETRIERIFAESSEAHSFLNVKTGEVAFSINIESFRFRIKLMQEHFNEQYMESARYPRASFSGFLEQPEKINMKAPSELQLHVKGRLTIRGIAQEISAPVKLTIGENNLISGVTEFTLRPEDFGIKIPSVVGRKIAKEVAVSVRSEYQPYAAP